MKNRTKIGLSLALSLALLAGCSTSTGSATGDAVAAADAISATDDTAAGAAIASETVAAVSEENAATHESGDDYLYDEDDVVEVSLGTESTADSGAVAVEDSTVTISAAGTYRVTGALTDGQVIVDAADDAVVQLILDDVDIANADGAAIAVM
ncbi:MAG: carbohydrate-binding domain-containing protein, partial [Acidimicrobiia bacterium]|nr:carbohydrate-binding domain-containing protein [Acidimicrobiia bacterium]